MYFVYLLSNEKNVWYIGYTNDLKRRLKEHQAKNVYSTKRIGGHWRLIYYEACLNQYDALRRERFLKSGQGRTYLRKRLRFQIKENSSDA